MNLLDERLTIRSGDGPPLVLESAGFASVTWQRATDEIKIGDSIVPISRIVFNKITGLPEPQQDTFYIVSEIVAKAALVCGRCSDLLIPKDLLSLFGQKGHACRALTQI